MWRMSICSMTFDSTSRQSSMIASWNTMPTSVCGRSTALAADRDGAGAVRHQARDHLENGGLAAAARADDRRRTRTCLMSRLTSTQASTSPSLGLVASCRRSAGGCAVRLILLSYARCADQRRPAADPRRRASRRPRYRSLALLLRHVGRLGQVFVGVVDAHVRLRLQLGEFLQQRLRCPSSPRVADQAIGLPCGVLACAGCSSCRRSPAARSPC